VCSGNGSVGGTVGSRPIPAQLAGCSNSGVLGRYSDVAGVSLSDWPPLTGSGLSLNTFKGRLDKYWGHQSIAILWICVFIRRQVNSQQVTGLTSKAEEGYS